MSQATNLQVSSEETAAWGRKLVITVPVDRVKAERGKVARQLAKRVRVPGFRKGKVPPDRIEARLGGEIDRQTQQNLIEHAFREAIRAEELEPVSEPRVGNVSYDRDSELTFEVEFDIRPEIRLGRVGGFRLSRPEVSVGEDDVDSQLEALRRQQAIWKPVERRPTTGDSVEVEIAPVDSDAEEGGEARPYRFELGQGRAIPDVESAIMTLEPGAAGEFEIEFPEDFDDEERRGTKQRLQIRLKGVLERELPELDDEFAQSLGDFEDLGALREAVREDLQAQEEREIEQRLNQQIIEQIIEANPFEVPESMVARYVDALVGEPPEGADPDLVERARAEARPAADWGIKRTLVLQRVAEDQGLEATEEDVSQRLEAIARRTKRPAGEVRARLAKSGELRDLKRRITEEKVFNYLREQSEIETRTS